MSEMDQNMQPIKDAAAELDIRLDQMRRYVVLGAPHEKRGNRYYCDPCAITAWMKAEGYTGDAGARIRDPDLNAARLRKENAMANNWEIRNAELEGRLVDGDKANQWFASVARVIRNKLQSVGAQNAPVWISIPTVVELQQAIDKTINESLESLSGEVLEAR